MCIEYNRTSVETYAYLSLCLCPLSSWNNDAFRNTLFLCCHLRLFFFSLCNSVDNNFISLDESHSGYFLKITLYHWVELNWKNINWNHINFQILLVIRDTWYVVKHFSCTDPWYIQLFDSHLHNNRNTTNHCKKNGVVKNECPQSCGNSKLSTRTKTWTKTVNEILVWTQLYKIGTNNQLSHNYLSGTKYQTF